jgi:hypothetical protein
VRTVALHINVRRSGGSRTKLASWGVSRSHVPSQLLQLSAHLRFGLPQISSTGRQYPALETHLLTTATWVMWDFVLLNIASNLESQHSNSNRTCATKHKNEMFTFCCRHSTQAFRLEWRKCMISKEPSWNSPLMYCLPWRSHCDSRSRSRACGYRSRRNKRTRFEDSLALSPHTPLIQPYAMWQFVGEKRRT